MSKYADHDEDGVSHVEDELKQAWKDGWDAIVPSALTPAAQWQRNDLYVPLSQVKKRYSEADQRDAPEGTWCWTKTAIAVPRDGDTVLCYWAKDKLHRMDKYIGEAEYGGGQWYNPENDEDDYRVPTHWMPLPPSPNGDEER